MSFGASAAIIGTVASVGSSIYSANKQAKAAKGAASAQADASQAGIDEQARQFDAIQELLKPFITGGTSAFTAQGNLAGINGNGAQQSAISALQASPQFTALMQQGENAILQNASATGGLRGGNTQAALAQFRPALLAQTINDQYSRLGGLSSLGQNSAALQGNAGLATGNNISNLLQQQGAAIAGGQLSQGREQAGYANAISQGIGSFFGAGGRF